MAPVSNGVSLPDPPLPLRTNYRTFALLGSGGLWEALVGQEGVWGGFGEALGGFGEALGRLWEALGRLWEGFGRRPSVRPIYIRIFPTGNSRSSSSAGAYY